MPPPRSCAQRKMRGVLRLTLTETDVLPTNEAIGYNQCVEVFSQVSAEHAAAKKELLDAIGIVLPMARAPDKVITYTSWYRKKPVSEADIDTVYRVRANVNGCGNVCDHSTQRSYSRAISISVFPLHSLQFEVPPLDDMHRFGGMLQGKVAFEKFLAIHHILESDISKDLRELAGYGLTERFQWIMQNIGEIRRDMMACKRQKQQFHFRDVFLAKLAEEKQKTTQLRSLTASLK